MTIHESETEEEDAPGFADATLHYRHFQPPRDLEESEAEGAEGDKEGCAPPFQPRELAVGEAEEYQEEDARHQQGTEEPESAGEELVVAAHAEDDVDDTLESDLEGIGMCDSACPVAVGLVEDTHGEHQIVDQQEEETPLHEGDIETLESFGAEIPGPVDIAIAEEIACCEEEEGHVEKVYEIHKEGRPLGVPHHHENDGDALGNRDGSISFFCHN